MKMNKLEFAPSESRVQWCSVPLKYKSYSQNYPSPQPNTWVKLLELPNPYTQDEALLLCEDAPETWDVWIPEYGETTLTSGQFCLK